MNKTYFGCLANFFPSLESDVFIVLTVYLVILKRCKFLRADGGGFYANCGCLLTLPRGQINFGVPNDSR